MEPTSDDGVATSTYLQTASSSSDSSTYTFTSQNIGTASSDRYIVGVIGSRKSGASATITSATIGGIDAIVVLNSPFTGTSTGYTGIIIAPVPTGTTATVVINFSGTMVRCTLGLYALTNINPTAFDTGSAGGTSLSGSVDVRAGGVTIGVAANSINTAVTWSSLTEDYDDNTTGETTYRASSASLVEPSTTTRTVTVTTASWSEASLSLVHFRALPSSGGGPWYNSSWTYRTKITVNNAEVDSNLTNFPVYVDLANLPAGFHTNVKAAGADIRVTSSDMTTELAREVVFYDAATDTGELHFKAPTVNGSSDTDFYIYYGNSGASDYSATDTYGRNAVWSTYDAVYHFGGTSLATTDSKGTYNLTAVNTPTGTTGKLAGQGSNHVSGSSQYFTNTLTTAYGTNPKSMSMWFKTSTTGKSQAIWSKRVSTAYMQACIFLASNTGGTAGQQVVTSDIGTGTVQRSAISPLGYANGVWHLAHYVRDATSTRVYVDGALKASQTGPMPNNTNTAPHYIGALNDGVSGTSTLGGFYFNGQLDEGRLYSGALSADWIDAEYSNQNAPTTFYTVGSQETYSPSTNSTNFFMLLR